MNAQIRFRPEFRDALHSAIAKRAPDLEASQRAVDALTELALASGDIVDVGPEDGALPRLAFNVRLADDAIGAVGTFALLRLSRPVSRATEAELVEGVNAILRGRVAKGVRVFQVVLWEV